MGRHPSLQQEEEGGKEKERLTREDEAKIKE